MKIPKVFISYSHDTLEHKKWVLDLAIRMRNNGIDAIIDQWELKPGDDLPHFMETHLSNSDLVLMICSEKYVEKANEGKGGVGYEKMIITSNLLTNIDENKIIPIIRQTSTNIVPTFLKTKLYLNFSKIDDYEFSFDELIRTIHKSPLYKKPEIGNNPFKETDDKIELKVHDGLLELMTVIINKFESNTNTYILYTDVFQSVSVSRILLDILLKQAAELKYIKQDGDGDIQVLENGKIYAINNKLV